MAGMADVARGAGVKVDVVEDVFNEVLRILCRGDSVRIKGFGVFERKTYPGRTLNTPVIPDQTVTFPDSYRMKFRQSQIAKHRLNVKASAKAKGRASLTLGGAKPKRQPTVKGKKVAKKPAASSKKRTPKKGSGKAGKAK